MSGNAQGPDQFSGANDRAKMCDLLIQHGRVVDPSQQLDAPRDVAFRSGRVAAIAERIDPRTAMQVLDASGKLVVPGLVDLHVHAFWGVSRWGIDPDAALLATGVTTALDVGSAGADTLPGFRRFIVERSDIRLRALINLSSLGMISERVNEVSDLRYADPERAAQTVAENRDLILGVKVRLPNDESDVEVLKLARQAAEAAAVPLMLDAGSSCSPLPQILGLLRANDVLTHCYRPARPLMLDDAGKPLPELMDARARGVLLDVGHGTASFSFAIARRALSHGLLPDTISSDLHAYSLQGPVFDLPTTLSKFLHLGLALPHVIARATASPALWMGLDGEIGTLRPGASGDVAVLELADGAHALSDCIGETVQAGHKLITVAVVKDGRLVDLRKAA